jgi:hypothetical protein
VRESRRSTGGCSGSTAAGWPFPARRRRPRSWSAPAATMSASIRSSTR